MNIFIDNPITSTTIKYYKIHTYSNPHMVQPTNVTTGPERGWTNVLQPQPAWSELAV